ncbi:hypothetical protein Cgig2_019219 [Carnegiea gigantea]|uniref:Aminotransferase-like plant mobile domain-containing protein n=1 Tax=Carnegiea gigantea TaxID=171969 RepID=A0A9Q1GJ42_9CARY|nr:hypothetical protein Cgig2_019219 [Carnegiea gigantea]
MVDLNVTAEGEPATFLTFWLSRFVLPHGKEVISLETFVMAGLDGFWATNFLGPTALGYIYHGLRKAASHPDHPGKANTIFRIHYVIGWLAELFPFLYHRRPNSDCSGDFLALVYYAGLLGSKLSLPQARHVFRDGRYLSLSASSYCEDSCNGRDVVDMGLPGGDFKFLLTLRQQRNVMYLTQPYADLQRRDTGVKFYVPPSYYEGATVTPKRNLHYHPLKKEKPRGLLASRAQLSSKIEEILGVVETTVKIEDLVDINPAKVLSDQDLTYSSEIAHIENQLNSLSSKASKLKVKEQEVLREDKRIYKIREDLTIQQQGKLKSSLGLKKKEAEQVKADLAKVGFSKLQDLEKEKNHLKSLISSGSNKT